jgi:hypothetical protein
MTWRMRARHRACEVEAPVPRAVDADIAAVLAACRSARDRLIVLLLARAGLRRGEAAGLRRCDLHLLADSRPLGCEVPRPHLHVMRREDNPNAAWAKSRRRQRVIPLDFLTVQAFDTDRLLRAGGRLASRQGSGTRAAGPARLRSLIGRDAAAIDLATAGLGADGIVTRELLADASAEVLSLGRETAGYFPLGLPSLRQAIAAHLSGRGLATSSRSWSPAARSRPSPLLAHLLAGHGTSVAVENPTYAGALDAFAAAGARRGPQDRPPLRPSRYQRPGGGQGGVPAHGPRPLPAAPAPPLEPRLPRRRRAARRDHRARLPRAACAPSTATCSRCAPATHQRLRLGPPRLTVRRASRCW